MNRPNFIVSTNVWGEDYVNEFLEIGIESLLKEIREFDLLNENSFVLSINTDSNSIHEINAAIKNKIEKSEILFRTSVIRVLEHSKSLRHLTGYNIGKYNIHSIAVNDEIKRSSENDVIIFNYSDFVWGNGSLRNLVQLFNSNDNIDIVLNHPLTIDKNKQMDLRNIIYSDLGITNQEITNISIDSAKWWYEKYEWLNHEGDSYQSLIYWPLNEKKNSYLFRGFHLNLLAVRKVIKGKIELPLIKLGTLDGNYYPWQLKPLSPTIFFVDDLSFINIGTFASQDISTLSKNRFGHYIGNLQRLAKREFGKNEISNLFNSLIISTRSITSNENEKYKALTIQHLKPILDLEVPIINSSSIYDLVLSRAIINRIFELNIFILYLVLIPIFIFARIPYFLLRFIATFGIFVPFRVTLIATKIFIAIKIITIWIRKRILSNSYFKPDHVRINGSPPNSSEALSEIESINIDVKHSLLRAVYRSINAFYELLQINLTIKFSKIDFKLNIFILKILDRIKNLKS